MCSSPARLVLAAAALGVARGALLPQTFVATVREARLSRRAPHRTAVFASLAESAAAVSLPDKGSSKFGATPPAVSLLSPCKINLFLRILRRRGDGFHELASLFQTVSLFDTLDFWELPPDPDEPLCSMEVTPDSLGAADIPVDDSNLVMRAMALFAERTGEKRRLHCRLHKAIPAQGGLGGGSADAATALFAANRLAGYPATQEQLIEWGAELGSDISFFFSRGTAYCTGRGERPS